MSEPLSRSEDPTTDELKLRNQEQNQLRQITSTTTTGGSRVLVVLPSSAPPQIFVEVHDILTVISSYLSVSDSLRAGSVCHKWRVAVFDIPYLQSIREEVKKIQELKAQETDPSIEMTNLSSSKKKDGEGDSSDDKGSEAESDSSSQRKRVSGSGSDLDDLSSSEDEAERKRREKKEQERRDRKQKRREEKRREKEKDSSEKTHDDDGRSNSVAIDVFESSSSDNDSDEEEGSTRKRDFPPYTGPKQLKFLARGAHMGTQLRPIDSALMVMASPEERVTHFPVSFKPEPWQHWHNDAKGMIWMGFLCHAWDIWFAFFMTFTASGAFSAIQTGIWSGMGALTLMVISLFYAIQTTTHPGKTGAKGFPSKFLSQFMGYVGNLLGLSMSILGVVLFILITSALHRTSTVPIQRILLFFSLGWACFFVPVIVGGIYIAFSGSIYSDRMAVEERKKAKKAKTTPPDMRRGSIIGISNSNGTRTDGKYSDYPLSVLIHGLLAQQPTTLASITLVFCQFSTLPCKALSNFNESGIIASFLMISLAALMGFCWMSWKVVDLVERRRLSCRKEGYGGFFLLSVFFWMVVSLQLLFVKAHTDLVITTNTPLVAETHCNTAYGRPVYDRGALSIKISDTVDKWELSKFEIKEKSAEIHTHGVTNRGIFSVTTFSHKDTGCKISLMSPPDPAVIRGEVDQWDFSEMNQTQQLKYVAKLPAPGQYMMTAWRLLHTDEAQGWVLRADEDDDNRNLDLWSAYIPQLCPEGFSASDKCSCKGTTCHCPLQGPCSLRLVPPEPLFNPSLLWLFTAVLCLLPSWLLIFTRYPIVNKRSRLLTRSKNYLAQRDLWKELKEGGKS